MTRKVADRIELTEYCAHKFLIELQEALAEIEAKGGTNPSIEHGEYRPYVEFMRPETEFETHKRLSQETKRREASKQALVRLAAEFGYNLEKQ